MSSRLPWSALALAGALLLPEPISGQKPARDKIATASKKGEKVDVRRHLARGKYTVFEFYADW